MVTVLGSSTTEKKVSTNPLVMKAVVLNAGTDKVRVWWTSSINSRHCRAIYGFQVRKVIRCQQDDWGLWTKNQ